MAITVKHSKVSLIPDGDDTSVVRPSDWNADHTLVGLGTMAEQDANNVAITGGTISGVSISGYVPTTRTLTAGTGLSGGGDLSANRTFAIANTGVTAASYGSASKTLTATVNAQGQLTSLADTNIAIANTQVSGLGTASTKDAGVALGVATLDSAGKVPLSEIPDSIIGALNYQGTWNASTNTPTLTSGTGTKGYYYVVSVAGTTNLDGITDWQVGDWAVYNGTAWQKIDNTDGVTSVNGFTGAVVLTTTNINEGTNLYYTDARARAAISAGTGLSYNSTSGAMNFSTASVATWAATPSSANLAAAVTDETGSGSLVFGTNPTLANPNIDVIDFDTTYATTLTAGQLGWDGNNTLGIGMAGGNVIQHIGEDQFFYCKASSAITKGQVVMFTGAVGASGVPTGAPATGITDGTYIMGIAAESIATNGFGLVQTFGTLRNVNTSGYADGDILWYNPAVIGGLTKTQPVAPNVKVQMAAVINGGSSGGGTILIRINPGSTLGGTDSNAQITTPSNGQILSYDGTNAYWKNTSIASGTGISVSASATGVLTITNTSPSSGGTVTSVSGTAPISVANGTTTPAISISQATTSTDGYLSSTDWNTFNNKQPAGTYVTSVSGTTGRITSSGGTTPAIDLASGIATPGTTGSSSLIPVITVDTYGRVTSITTASNPQGTVTSVSGTGTVSGISLSGTVTSSGNLTLGGSLDLSSPPAIGGTTPAAITGTTITATKFVGVSGGTF